MIKISSYELNQQKQQIQTKSHEIYEIEAKSLKKA